MKIFFFQWIVWHWRVLGRWRVQDLQEYQVFFFSSNRRDLDLEVDRTQLSLEVGEIQLSLEVGEIQLFLELGDQLSFISAAPTQNSVTRMENASKPFNCELKKKQGLRPSLSS